MAACAHEPGQRSASGALVQNIWATSPIGSLFSKTTEQEDIEKAKASGQLSQSEYNHQMNQAEQSKWEAVSERNAYNASHQPKTTVSYGLSNGSKQFTKVGTNSYRDSSGQLYTMQGSEVVGGNGERYAWNGNSWVQSK